MFTAYPVEVQGFKANYMRTKYIKKHAVKRRLRLAKGRCG